MATMRSSCLIIISLLVLGSLSAFAVTFTRKPMDVNDHRVVQIAILAITEYNHNYNANLKLVKIASCVTEARRGGDLHELVLLASKGTTRETNKYQARLTVWLTMDKVE
ncbi:hypothetical protein HN51_003894 [Arachis hypogaea]|uniref:Cystatin domain-containing protein n=1 Tax=Arachis hypogaea TaxID=3818 RepID=A0A445DJE6_ARAHY|nr:uncharacterized protein DS421_4g111530 [Arachis hypogaea]RYR63299.1 hypothetical protein Ahy_A04g021101 [Arachis hypogaea]